MDAEPGSQDLANRNTGTNPRRLRNHRTKSRPDTHLDKQHQTTSKKYPSLSGFFSMIEHFDRAVINTCHAPEKECRLLARAASSFQPNNMCRICYSGTITSACSLKETITCNKTSFCSPCWKPSAFHLQPSASSEVDALCIPFKLSIQRFQCLSCSSWARSQVLPVTTLCRKLFSVSWQSVRRMQLRGFGRVLLYLSSPHIIASRKLLCSKGSMPWALRLVTFMMATATATTRTVSCSRSRFFGR